MKGEISLVKVERSENKMIVKFIHDAQLYEIRMICLSAYVMPEGSEQYDVSGAVRICDPGVYLDKSW